MNLDIGILATPLPRLGIWIFETSIGEGIVKILFYILDVGLNLAF